MVWVHGGAYILGSASQALYDGRVLAGSGDVIVVTLSYRLGAFGFLDLSSFSTPHRRFDTNLGLRDVLAALEWVRDNIAAFGGDPARVTLFGESAGAGIITTLLTSPAAKDLFAGAIAQSSPATSVYDHNRARTLAEELLDRIGVEPARYQPACPTCPSTRSLPCPGTCSTTFRSAAQARWPSSRLSMAMSYLTIR